MRCLIFEHVTAGGCVGGNGNTKLPKEILSQGWAMLEAIVSDVAALGVHVDTIVHRSVDRRIEQCEHHIVASRYGFCEQFDELAVLADWVLVIAPETDGVLMRWLRRLEKLGVEAINCSVAATALCGDKLELASHLRECSVSVPRTARLDRVNDGWFSDGKRVVVKPRFGAGCEETVVYDSRSVEAFYEAVEEKRLFEGSDGEFIAQEFVSYRPCSAMMFVGDEGAMFIGACDQHIDIAMGPSSEAVLGYRGGQVADDHINHWASALGFDVINTLDNLRGFVGIDLMVGEHFGEQVVIEVNPRLTMSYVGLRAACKTNIANVMMGGSRPMQWANDPVRFDLGGTIYAS